jgi:hypothetical protein
MVTMGTRILTEESGESDRLDLLGAQHPLVSEALLTTSGSAPPRSARETVGSPRQRMFTALAASTAITASEIVACIIIRILAQRESAAVSAGDNAVLVLKAKNIPNAPTLGPN